MKNVINISEEPIKTLFSNRFCFNVVSQIVSCMMFRPISRRANSYGRGLSEMHKGLNFAWRSGIYPPKSLIKASKYLKAHNDPKNPPMAKKDL